MGNVVQLKPQRPPKRDTKRPMPERFTADERRRILRRAMRDGYTFEEVQFAVLSVRAWAETNSRLRAKWDLVVTNGMRLGWALRGFRQWQKRQPGRVNPRTGEKVSPRTPITDELIERLAPEE